MSVWAVEWEEMQSAEGVEGMTFRDVTICLS